MELAQADYRLNDWIIRTQRSCIERGEESRRVKPKAMQVLECLLRAKGSVVSRTQLFDTVWPGQAVSDDALTNCIVELRKAFGDSAKHPHVIETIPKKGFRIVSHVSPVDVGRRATSPTQPYAWTVAIAAILCIGLVAVFGWPGLERPVPPAAIQSTSIAVLPFVDMSPDGDQEYFADGLSEELINRLTQLDGLLVTGRTSSFYFKGRNESLRAIGEQLSVTHVLEGSVRKSGSELRITAQLIDVESGFHLWSDTYDREFSNVFAIQDDISDSVATALSVRLKVGEIGRYKGGTDNVAAFDAAMKANAEHKKFTVDGMLDAMQHYKTATELDPEFALAWRGLANVYRTAWLTLGDEDAEHWSRLADHAIEMARASAPDSEHILLTSAYIEVDRQNWTAARRLFDMAAELNSDSSGETSAAYLDLMAKTGDIGEALKSKARFQLVDPLHPHLAMYLGHLYLMSGKVDAAIAELERGYSLDGYDPQISVEGLIAALASGDEDLIRHWLNRAVENQQPGAMGIHDAMAERFGDSRAALDYLRAGFDSGTVPDYYVIVWGSYYGDDELALTAMRRSPDLWAFWTPLTEHLRQTGEFRDILVDIGLVDYWREYGWNDYCRPVSESEFRCS